MRKIPSLFVRESYGKEHNPVKNEINPESAWVFLGEGVATRKWDGLALLIQGGKPYRRYDAKAGRTPPSNFQPAQPQPDSKSGHWPGWVPLDINEKHIMSALEKATLETYQGPIPDGTYEVCGPKIGTRHGPNPEKLTEHILVPHGKDILQDVPLTFEGIAKYLSNLSIEGIVFHHPDGRMAKIKKNDFPIDLLLAFQQSSSPAQPSF